MTHTEVIQSWNGQHRRFLTLLVSGNPAGNPHGRSDYWSLSLKQATELASALLDGVVRACDAEIQAASELETALRRVASSTTDPYLLQITETALAETKEQE